MNTEINWWVELSGDDSEKAELAWMCTQTDFPLHITIKKEFFFRAEEAYYLKSSRFAGLTSKEVRQEAIRLIPVIRAIAKARNRYKFQSIKLGDNGVMTEDGRPATSVIFATAGEVRAETTRATVTIGGHDIPTLKPEHDHYLNHSGLIDDLYVYDTFSYFADPPSWLSLWNTYEMIKFDVDDNLNHEFSSEKCKITEYSWAEKEELEDFTTTANHYLAEGKPRHTRAYELNEERKRKKGNLVREQKRKIRKKEREAERPLMNPSDAYALIKRIFKGWCKWKIDIR